MKPVVSIDSYIRRFLADAFTPYSVSISFILQWCDIYFSNIALQGSKELQLMFWRLRALC